MTPRVDIREHFGEFASRYEEEAFEAGSGVREVSERELAVVEYRLRGAEGRRVLDAGVGTGRFARMLIRRGAHVVGMDLTPEMLHVCAQNEPLARLVQARLGSPLPFADATFDDAVCVRVIKYLEDWAVALAELRRVVRPGGRLVLEVANRRSLARWGYSGMPVYLFTSSEATRLLESNGFQLRSIDGGTRLPFLVYRWTRTESRLQVVRFIERLIGTALGQRLFARSLIFTCEADPGWERAQPAPSASAGGPT
jgi:SAM-dependent methyltransferase